MLGCPIRKSADHIVRANPRSLSQLITSFIASESLGIRHTPLFSLLYFLHLIPYETRFTFLLYFSRLSILRYQLFQYVNELLSLN